MKRCLLVFSLVLVFALLLGACAADEFSDAPAAPPDMPPWADEAPAPADASDDFNFAPAETAPEFDFELADPAPDSPAVPNTPGRDAADSTGSPGPPPILTPSDANGRRLVYSVNMHLQTTEFMSGIRLLYDTISELNGFIMRESVQGRDLRTPEVERSASYTIRLYTDNLPNFIVIMEDNFNLLNRHLESDDVTASYEHAGLTLTDMREHEQRLRDELDNPDLEIYEQLDLESALAEVQSYIRSLETHLSATDDDILFSFINLLLFEVVIPEEVEDEEEEEVVELTFGERFNNAASSSWAGFIGFSQGLLIVIIRILPTLLILGAIAVVVVIIVRYIKKRRKQNPRQNRQKATGTDAHTGYQNWNNNAHWNQYAPNAAYTDPNSTQNNPAAQNYIPNDNDPNASGGNGA